MNTKRLLITLVLLAAMLLAGCNSRVKVGALRTESKSVELGDAEAEILDEMICCAEERFAVRRDGKTRVTIAVHDPFHEAFADGPRKGF